MKKLRVKGGDLRVVNPPDEYRKSQRTKEKKKNKAERRFNREQSILRRNPRVIKEELDQLREVQRNGSLTDSQRRRMAKLEQLWDIAIKAVEAEKRARKAELQLDAALSAMTGATEQADEDGDQKPSAALTSKDQRNILNTGGLGDRRKCLPADICYDDEYLLKKEEEQRRFYNPYLCNAGIFRHPDGSLRGYPPSVRPDVFGQRREFVESLKANTLRARANEEEEEDDDESDSSDSDKSSRDEENDEESKGDDLLESIPLPSEPPPDDAVSVPATAPPDPLQQAAEAGPLLLPPFPMPPTSGQGGEVVPPGQGAFPFFPPHLAFPPPVPFIPPPPAPVPPFQQQQHQQVKGGDMSVPAQQIPRKTTPAAASPGAPLLSSPPPSGSALPSPVSSGLAPVSISSFSSQSPSTTGAMRQGGGGRNESPARTLPRAYEDWEASCCLKDICGLRSYAAAIVPVGLEGSHDQRGEEVQNLRTEYSAPSSLTGVGQKGPLVPVAEPRAGLVIEANSGELGHSAFRPAIRTRFSSHSNVVQCEDSFRSKTRVAASGSTPRVGLQPVTGFMTGLNAQSRQQLDRAKNTTFGSGATRRSYAGLLSGKVDSSGVGGGTTNEANGEQGGKSVDLDELFDDFLKEVGEV